MTNAATVPGILDTDTSNRPIRRSMTRDGELTLLEFGPDAAAPAGAYVMRGGIAWPRRDKETGRVEGYAVLCGRHEASGTIYVFEEQSFVTVDWLKLDKTIQPDFPPIAPFFGVAWHYYQANVFYWRLLGSLISRQQREYVREVHQCASIKPDVSLPSIEWQDEDRALVRIFMQERQDRLAYRPHDDPAGGVARALIAHKTSPNDFPVALEALSSAMIALGKVR